MNKSAADRDLRAASPEEVGLSLDGIVAAENAVREYVDGKVLSGAVTLVARRGRTVRVTPMGFSNVEKSEPMQVDTMFRIFSMTKPVTAVAMMVLFDEGRWKPEDPIAKHLPEFAGLRFATRYHDDGSYDSEPPSHAPTMLELMTHRAGFVYGLSPLTPLDKLYLQSEIWNSANLAEFCRRLATLPLAYQPGTRWEYSLSMDVQGAIIERITGQSLADFMQERIFGPLGMKDTAFYTPPEKVARRATLYYGSNDGGLEQMKKLLLPDHEAPPGLAVGGGGLISCIADYARFGQMLLNQGSFGGKKIISAEAAKLMMSNHMPDEMLEVGYGAGHQKLRPGFGYGFNGVVFTDPQKAGIPVGAGTYHWDGAAGTWFWVDPVHDLMFIGLIQRMAYDAPPLQAMTQTLMAKAIVD